MKNGLQNTAGQPKPRSRHNGGADTGHSVITNHQIDFLIRGSSEDSPDKLRHRGIIGAGTQGQQHGHQKQQCQKNQKQGAANLVFSVVRQLVFRRQG